MNDISIQWDVIQKRFAELQEQVSSTSLEGKRHLVQKELSYLSTLLSKHKEIKRLEAERQSIAAEKAKGDSELASLYDEELERIDAALLKRAAGP